MTQIKQTFTDNSVLHEFLTYSHLSRLYHPCAKEKILLNCDLSPFSATNSAKATRKKRKDGKCRTRVCIRDTGV